MFVPAGLVKFVFHSWELHNFQAFGLPWPGALEILAGGFETGGGLLLPGTAGGARVPPRPSSADGSGAAAAAGRPHGRLSAAVTSGR
ncbi:MAG TPA: hypothetical protein VII01_14935 [Solirubrobacteraceae bacterium]